MQACTNLVWQFATAGNIKFGRGCSVLTTAELVRLNVHRPLIVSDTTVIALAPVARLIADLRDAGFNPQVFDACVPEPAIETAKNAIEAGFDGVELHGANGYLLEEFLSPISNVRKDKYDGSIENRCRFVIEVATAVALAIGKDKLGIRLSPYGVASDMPHYPEIDATYDYLSKELNKLDIAYIHLVDHSAMGAPTVPIEIKQLIRHNFKNTLIICGGYDKDSAEADIESGLCDLVGFGRHFINNPDLVERLEQNEALSQNLKMELFYSANAEGYTDYPNFKVPLVLQIQ